MLIEAAEQLRAALRHLEFPEPVAYTYNPLDYAWDAHRLYLETWGLNPPRKRVLFLGMNPGPFGMAQTGVPFGDVAMVRDYLGIRVPVTGPARQHPKRPVTGFDCPRSEVSGTRLWSLFRDMYGPASVFFRDHFVVNFCPLVWMSETGANITPDKLPAKVRSEVETACQRHLVANILALEPELLVGVGKYAEKQLKQALGELPADLPVPRVGCIIHPSPASPQSNRCWPELPRQQILALEAGELS